MATIEELVYESDVAAVGTFRCPRHHRRFAGGSTDAGLVVFPRTSVVIERDRGEPVVADPTTIVFYNAGEHYRRRGVDARGDHCDYFALRNELVEEISAAGGALGSGDDVIRFTHGPASAELYLSQRWVVDALAAGEHVDPLLVDELAVAIVASAIWQASELAGQLPETGTTTQHRHAEVVRRTKRVVLDRSPGPLSLAEIATEVAVSPYHLARLFRRHTGFTIHDYVTHLRLRRALDVVARSDVDLATVALELGFSSHSHFTRTFRSVFGCTPSSLRESAAPPIDDLRKIVTA